jgi:hypothetical protein
VEVVAAIFWRTSESGQVHSLRGARPFGRAPFLCRVSAATNASVWWVTVCPPWCVRPLRHSKRHCQTSHDTAQPEPPPCPTTSSSRSTSNNFTSALLGDRLTGQTRGCLGFQRSSPTSPSADTQRTSCPHVSRHPEQRTAPFPTPPNQAKRLQQRPGPADHLATEHAPHRPDRSLLSPHSSSTHVS